MTLTQEQLEWIVSEVVRRLREAEPAPPMRAAGRLRMDCRLITLESLRGKLDGVTQLEVGRRAVVTPAVVDLLKERRVELVKT